MRGSDFLIKFGLSLYIVICSEEMVEALAEGHDLCIGGDCFEMLLQTSAVTKVIPYVKVVTEKIVDFRLLTLIVLC